MSAGRRIAAVTAVAVVLAVGAPWVSTALAGGLTAFSSPTTNIGCELFEAEGHWIARCDIRQREWAPPRKPRSCKLDYGNGVYVSSVGGRARYECAGDTALGAKRILAYGHSIRRGSIRCLSQDTGMTCENVADHHGFLISREVVKLH